MLAPGATIDLRAVDGRESDHVRIGCHGVDGAQPGVQEQPAHGQRRSLRRRLDTVLIQMILIFLALRSIPAVPSCEHQLPGNQSDFIALLPSIPFRRFIKSQVLRFFEIVEMDLQQIIQLLSQRLAIDKPPTPPAAVAGARPSQQSATSSSQHSPDNPASVPNPQYNTPPTSVHHWLRRRRLDPGHCRTLISPSVRKRLPWRWAESYWDTENLDKIFSCKWLDDRHALIGTKCHQLRLLDTGSGESHIVPTGSTTDTIRPQEPMKPRGIHTISSNFAVIYLLFHCILNLKPLQ